MRFCTCNFKRNQEITKNRNENGSRADLLGSKLLS